MQRDPAGVKGRYHHVPAFQPHTWGQVQANMSLISAFGNLVFYTAL